MSRGRGSRTVLVVAALGSLLAACSGGAPSSTPTAREPVSTASAAAGTEVVLPAGDPYAAAVDAVAASGARVWIETDLVKSWLAGPAAFTAGVTRVAALARRRGVDGIKIADELGYQDGTTGPTQVGQFLSAAATALHAAAPGRLLLVDMVVPELGCLPWHHGLPAAASCAAQQAGRFPGATMAATDGYLRSGTIDVLDLSVGLRPDSTYASWGIGRDQAEREAWAEAGRRGWPARVRLQARKALAHPGTYVGGAAAAGRDTTTFVDVPLASGAAAVDVWTWRQSYQGSTVRLLDPGLQDNALWQALLTRRRGGDSLWTHLSPSSVELGLAQDIAKLRTVFDTVFVAAGTG